MMTCIFGPQLKRRSSTTSSRQPLDLEENEGVQSPDHRVLPSDRGDRDDLFTIDDYGYDEEDDDYDEEGEVVSRRSEMEGYFYDEVFSPSQFQDERTQNSVRQLVSEDSNLDTEGHAVSHNDDELLDFDFETLGIKIDNYKIDPNMQRVV